jgi:hypothetical protein
LEIAVAPEMDGESKFAFLLDKGWNIAVKLAA